MSSEGAGCASSERRDPERTARERPPRLGVDGREGGAVVGTAPSGTNGRPAGGRHPPLSREPPEAHRSKSASARLIANPWIAFPDHILRLISCVLIDSWIDYSRFASLADGSSGPACRRCCSCSAVSRSPRGGWPAIRSP